MTWNPTTGCNKVSAGCKFCYAELMSRRLRGMGQEKYANGFKLTLHESARVSGVRFEVKDAGRMRVQHRVCAHLLERRHANDAVAAVDEGLEDGEEVRVRSRHGEARLRLRWDSRVKPGELFATFHAAEVFLNHLTGPHRDRLTMTPEYKVVAVRVEKG